MRDSINALLKEAKKLCDEDGFQVFKSKYCPTLGKSRTYELLAVEQGKKTIEQIKSDTARRMREMRSRNAAPTPQPGNNVTEKPSVTSRGSDLPDDAAPDDEAVIVPVRTPEQKAEDIVEHAIALVEDACVTDDLDRVTVLKALAEAIADELKEHQDTAPAEPPAKKRGRPPGSKNKLKPEAPATGNSVDPEHSVGEMGAKFAAMDAKEAETTAAAAPAPAATDDGSIPPFMRRAS
jgi:hypothetical protein